MENYEKKPKTTAMEKAARRAAIRDFMREPHALRGCASIGVLPGIMLRDIFAHLQDPQDLAHARATCRLWYQLVDFWPERIGCEKKYIIGCSYGILNHMKYFDADRLGFERACQYGHSHIIKYLVQYYRIPNIDMEIFSGAIIGGNTTIIKFLAQLAPFKAEYTSNELILDEYFINYRPESLLIARRHLGNYLRAALYCLEMYSGIRDVTAFPTVEREQRDVTAFPTVEREQRDVMAFPTVEREQRDVMAFPTVEREQRDVMANRLGLRNSESRDIISGEDAEEIINTRFEALRNKKDVNLTKRVWDVAREHFARVLNSRGTREEPTIAGVRQFFRQHRMLIKLTNMNIDFEENKYPKFELKDFLRAFGEEWVDLANFIITPDLCLQALMKLVFEFPRMVAPYLLFIQKTHISRLTLFIMYDRIKFNPRWAEILAPTLGVEAPRFMGHNNISSRIPIEFLGVTKPCLTDIFGSLEKHRVNDLMEAVKYCGESEETIYHIAECGYLPAIIFLECIQQRRQSLEAQKKRRAARNQN